jgi:hypothetical protein
MDGSGVTQPSGPGAGTINCQYGAGPWEQFDLLDAGGGAVGIRSRAFQNVFLRMDGRGVTQPTGPGGGIVNCQYGMGPWEKFRIEQQPDGSVALASIQFPGVYLRTDGRGVTAPTGPGGGTVNCQWTAGPWEKYHVVGVQIMQFTGPNQMACACLTAVNGANGQATAEIMVPAGAPSLLAGICGCDVNNVALPPAGLTMTVTAPGGTVYSSSSQTGGSVNVGLINGALVTLSVLDPAPGQWTISVTSTAGPTPWRAMLQALPNQQTAASWAAAAQAQFGGGQALVAFPHERAMLLALSRNGLYASRWACLGCKIFSYSACLAIATFAGTLAPEAAIVVQLVRLTGWSAEAAMGFIGGVAGYSVGEIVGEFCTAMDCCD